MLSGWRLPATWRRSNVTPPLRLIDTIAEGRNINIYNKVQLWSHLWYGENCFLLLQHDFFCNYDDVMISWPHPVNQPKPSCHLRVDFNRRHKCTRTAWRQCVPSRWIQNKSLEELKQPNVIDHDSLMLLFAVAAVVCLPHETSCSTNLWINRIAC